MRYPALAIAVPSIVLAIGCGSTATSSPKSVPSSADIAASTALPMMPKSADKGQSGLIAISDDVRRACGISDADAYFAFDSAYVRPNDRVVLAKLAECFASGPLKGRTMQLVGHADPRGDDSYNWALGGSRADSVKKFVVSDGLSASKVSTSSRGEIDATGTDEATWAKDRRVDVQIGS
jgi:peptidoglycan-associated lipoprotein